ncbi:MAG: choice-of-anchor tandem repeat GloVer-containing protein [Limisphaerales bacterium]
MKTSIVNSADGVSIDRKTSPLARAWRYMAVTCLAATLPSVCSAQWGFSLDGGGLGSTGANPGYYDAMTLVGTTLYGTTTSGGDYNHGVVFSVNTDGTAYQVLHSFDFTDGSCPIGPLVLWNGYLFGTTQIGGTNGDGWGTVFRVKTDGTSFKKLYDFGTVGGDGSYPHAGLVRSGSYLYGTTYEGGANGCGTVFFIGPQGNYFTFTSLSQMEAEACGALAVDQNGVLYGAGAAFGTVFTINPDLSGLNCLKTGLSGLVGPLLVQSSQSIYGSEQFNGSGQIFQLNVSSESITPLHSFSGGTDGQYPNGYMALYGNLLYGTCMSGGSYGGGDVFTFNLSSGLFSVVYSFGNSSNIGYDPCQGVVTDGVHLYGTTCVGGMYNNGADGTVFGIAP